LRGARRPSKKSNYFLTSTLQWTLAIKRDGAGSGGGGGKCWGSRGGWGGGVSCPCGVSCEKGEDVRKKERKGSPVLFRRSRREVHRMGRRRGVAWSGREKNQKKRMPGSTNEDRTATEERGSLRKNQKRAEAKRCLGKADGKGW